MTVWKLGVSAGTGFPPVANQYCANTPNNADQTAVRFMSPTSANSIGWTLSTQGRFWFLWQTKNETTWAAGDWVFNIALGATNMNVTITRMHVCRLNSSNEVQLPAVADTGAISQSLGTSSFQITANQASDISASSTDRFLVVLQCSLSMTGQSFAIDAASELTVPDASGPATFDAAGGIAGTGALSASGLVIFPTAASIAATGALTADAQVVGGSTTHDATADLGATAALAGAAAAIQPATAERSQTAELAAQAIAARLAQTALDADATLAAVGISVQPTGGELEQTAALSADATRTTTGDADMATTAGLTAEAIVLGGVQTYNADAALDPTATLTADAVVIRTTTAELSATTDLATNQVVIHTADGALQVEAVLDGDDEGESLAVTMPVDVDLHMTAALAAAVEVEGEIIPPLLDLHFIALAPELAHGPALTPETTARTALLETTPRVALAPETVARAAGDAELGHGQTGAPDTAHGQPEAELGHGTPGEPQT